MNQKKAKELRRAVRFEFGPQGERNIKVVLTGAQFIPGEPVIPGLQVSPGCHFLGQRSLNSSCGRAIYQ